MRELLGVVWSGVPPLMKAVAAPAMASTITNVAREARESLDCVFIEGYKAAGFAARAAIARTGFPSFTQSARVEFSPSPEGSLALSPLPMSLPQENDQGEVKKRKISRDFRVLPESQPSKAPWRKALRAALLGYLRGGPLVA